ncbi:hypothetical protein HK104_011020 [Borealophlyctis nickersoniae]|nr:hypothetical protein HK104_011020 [Borealophlyctis nickersoniae]
MARRPSPYQQHLRIVLYPGRRQLSRSRMGGLDVGFDDLEHFRVQLSRLYEFADQPPPLSDTDSGSEDGLDTTPSKRTEKLLRAYKDREDELRVAAGIGLDLLTKMQHLQDARASSDAQLAIAREDLENARAEQRSQAEANREAKTAKVGLLMKVAAMEVELRSTETKLARALEDVEEKEKQIGKLTRDVSKFESLKSENARLATELDTIKQEVLQAKSAETNMRRKYKKVAARCVELQTMHEKCVESHFVLPEAERSRMRKRGSSPDLKGQQDSMRKRLSDDPTQAPDATLLLSLVRELSASNTKLKGELAEARENSETSVQLKAELMEARELLSESWNELAALQGAARDEIGSAGSSKEDIPRKSVFAELESYVLSSSMPSRDMTSKSIMTKHDQTNKEDEYVIKKIFASTSTQDDDVSESPDGDEAWEGSTTASLPSESAGTSEPASSETQEPSSATTASPANKRGRRNSSSEPPAHIYLRTLHKMGDQLHKRLAATDTVTLNRKIRRTFDLGELSRLSNNVIENVLADVSELASRFPAASTSNRGVEEKGGGKGVAIAPLPRRKNAVTGAASGDVETLVLPLVTLVQGMLGDNAKLRMTLNEYALSYYEKINEKSMAPAHDETSEGLKSARGRAMPRSRSMGSIRSDKPTGSILPSVDVVVSLFRRKGGGGGGTGTSESGSPSTERPRSGDGGADRVEGGEESGVKEGSRLDDDGGGSAVERSRFDGGLSSGAVSRLGEDAASVGWRKWLGKNTL